MRVLVLHSDVAADAAPDDLDTLLTARAIAETLEGLGHNPALAAFSLSPDDVLAAIRNARADIVFNMVESVCGQDALASVAPAMLEKHGVPFTGSGAAAIALAGDKPLSKRVLRAANLPTPDWTEAPRWEGLADDRDYIVKSATEDASLGLDDGSVLHGRRAIASRAEGCVRRHGGRWFAEAYIEGREFNVALLEAGGEFEVLPIPEMRFERWPVHKARIVGYRAKWDEDSEESLNTVRVFGLEKDSRELASSLREFARDASRLFGMSGYARVDFRVDQAGRPTILEINPNPSLDPVAGFAMAAAEAGYSFHDVIRRILGAVLGN